MDIQAKIQINYESGYNLNENGTSAGMAWVTFKMGEEYYTLQACLKKRKTHAEDGSRRGTKLQKGDIYSKEINKSEDGMEDGVCSDINKKSFNLFGVDNAKELFFAAIRKSEKIRRL